VLKRLLGGVEEDQGMHAQPGTSIISTTGKFSLAAPVSGRNIR